MRPDSTRRASGLTGALFLVLLGSAAWVFASPVGSLAGHVKDRNGQPLPGVAVTVTGDGAVGIHHATTDANGLFQMVGLPTLEALEITAEAEGMIPFTYSGLELREGEITWRDFRLRPAGAHDILILYDPRVPYHETALQGARETLPGPVTVLELVGDKREDSRHLRDALGKRYNAVLAIGSAAAQLARREVRDAPVVYTMVLDPGVEDLHRVNLCGLALNGAFAEQLSVLKRLKPAARHIATIYDPRHLAGAVISLRRAAGNLGMRLTTMPARNAPQVLAALDSLRSRRLDAFFFLLDPSLFDAGLFEEIRRFSQGAEAAFIVPDPSFVAVGGTYSYGPGFREMGIYAGRLVLHIFSGAAEPSGIKVDFPVARSFSVNAHEIARLGLTIPDQWLQPTTSGGATASAPPDTQRQRTQR